MSDLEPDRNISVWLVWLVWCQTNQTRPNLLMTGLVSRADFALKVAKSITKLARDEVKVIQAGVSVSMESALCI